MARSQNYGIKLELRKNNAESPVCVVQTLDSKIVSNLECFVIVYCCQRAMTNPMTMGTKNVSG